MTKAIKFRLIKDGKVVGYEVHENGYIYHIDIIDNVKRNIKLFNYVCHDHKDQFTGLHDKNGKEIYVGDIVECEMEVEKLYYENGYASSSVHEYVGRMTKTGDVKIMPSRGVVMNKVLISFNAHDKNDSYKTKTKNHPVQCRKYKVKVISNVHEKPAQILMG